MSQETKKAIDALYDAYRALRDLGWRDAIYAPKDGTDIEIICMGSTGTFRARWHSFGHEPLDTCGGFFADDGGQTYPSDPVLWRPIESDLARGVRLARRAATGRES